MWFFENLKLDSYYLPMSFYPSVQAEFLYFSSFDLYTQWAFGLTLHFKLYYRKQNKYIKILITY